jgi:hypothetical protein
MGWRKNQITGGENLLVCNDLHKKRWDVTIGTFDAKVFCARIPGDWGSLPRVLARCAGRNMVVAYEAGYFASGFGFIDPL